MARGSLAHACIVVSLLASAQAHAATPTPGQLAAVRSLARTGDWEIRWDDETGSLATLSERRMRRGAAYRWRGRPVDGVGRAQAFLRAHADLFPMRADLDSLVLLDSHVPRRRRDGTSTVRLLQRYRGIPVQGGGYAVTLGPEGAVRFVNGRFHPGIELDPEPSIGAGEAQAIAVREVGEGADPVTEPVTALVTTRAGNYRLAWSVTVPEDWGHLWVVHVDAHDGSVIARGNRVMVDPR